MLVCVVGVSNSGKSTIVNALIRKWNIFFMPTATTRPMLPSTTARSSACWSSRLTNLS